MLVEGFEQLKNRVYDEFDKRNPKSNANVLVYPMASSARTIFMFGGVFFLLFFIFTVADVVYETFHPSSHIAHPWVMLGILYVGCPFWAGCAYYCLIHGLKVSKSKIELSDAGIARLEKDGSKVFIRWDDVARLTKRERMKQIGVYGLSDNKKVMVDFQFERFEQIRDRILNEFEKRFRLPSMPVTYGSLPVFPNSLPFLFIATFVGLIILAWVNDTRHQTWAFVFIELMLIIFYALILYGESRLVKTISLDGQGLTLYKVFGKIFIPWDKLVGIDQESKMVQHGRYFLVKLTAMDGKSYPFDDPLARRLEIFITLKKLLETKKAKSG